MTMTQYVTVTLVSLLCLFIFGDSLHMFQLNMYKSGAHFKWLSRNLFKVYFGGFSGGKAKKPLVYTPRVIRMCVTTWLFFTGALFFIYYLLDYRVMLALILLAPLLPIIANTINMPIEKANNARYIKDAKRIIDSMPNLVTIGVTGSYGKTSTKYYLHKLLSAKYNTLMTPESFNTTMGVVKTVRGQLKPTHEFFICEMGMMWKGDIAELCDIVKPAHAMITSIGAQHLETMKSLDNIIEEKFSITDTIGSDGNVYLNVDNENVAKRAKTLKDKTIVTYGAKSGAYRATDITLSDKGTTFTLHTPDGEKAEFTTLLIGTHNVQNIVGAIAVARTLGVSLQEMLLPVKRLECAPHRLQIIKRDDMTIIDDSFNSNPAGAKAALDALKLIGDANGMCKILITPGMVALGEKSQELNAAFGNQAAESCDYAVLVGERQAPPIREGLLQAGFDKDKIHIADSFNNGMKFATELQSKSKKIILIENDLPDNF
ncbi:MAG: UDP-N-acetylmuramoyl-tripeptide--D-alanyl-D-alanine ligase [Oscillospiraceae bacterium]|nr:UDP-N-acetylmuramoyl-tripeptide--D-alanyl-D-alanine ligase [Oscillospiraceae bacterium]